MAPPAPSPPFAPVLTARGRLPFPNRFHPQATLDLPGYSKRLALLYGGVLLLLGGPIAAQTFDPLDQVGAAGRSRLA